MGGFDLMVAWKNLNIMRNHSTPKVGMKEEFHSVKDDESDSTRYFV